MKFRKLRIAWSMLWGIACLLLIVLWVRSCWWMDNVEPFRGIRFMSVEGCVRINELVITNSYQRQTIGLFGTQSFPANALIPAGVGTAIPYVMLVAVTAAVSAGSSLKWSRRFSLRTLLIVTTLVAVVLGLIVYATRQ